MSKKRRPVWLAPVPGSARCVAGALCRVAMMVALLSALVLGPQPAPAEAAPSAYGYVWPVRDPSAPITAGWYYSGGSFHGATDIGVGVGTEVIASKAGTVSRTQGWDGSTLTGMQSYGNLVIVDHPDGTQTYYAHLSQILVTNGQSVSQGQVIAKSGRSGNVTGPHLHFEIRENGSRVDPQTRVSPSNQYEGTAYDRPPSNVELQIERPVYYAGERTTFYCYGDDASYFVVTVYDPNGNVVDILRVEPGGNCIRYYGEGEYTATVEGRNECGTTFGQDVRFTVKNVRPSNVELQIERPVYYAGERTTFYCYGDDASYFVVTVYDPNGNVVDILRVEPGGNCIRYYGEGEYTATVEGRNECGTTFGQDVRFTVKNSSQSEELVAFTSTDPVVLGEAATFVCDVEGAGDAELSYQWQYTVDGGETWRNLSWAGAKTSVISAVATAYRVKTQSYRCVVSASDGRAAESNAIAFEIAEPQVELSAAASTESVALGEQATFVCSVEGAGDAELTYQWQYTADGGETWRNLGWAGAKTDKLTAEATEYRARAQRYRCVVTASDGRTAESNAIAFEVAEPQAELVATASTEPVALDETGTFSCAVEGAGDAELSYQWQYSTDGGETWRNLGWSGAKTDKLSAVATEYRARTQSYRCVVTASDGRIAESNAVAFEVGEPQAVLAATASTEPVALGEQATFSCSVEGAGDAELSYQWQYSTDGGETWRALGWAGAKTSELSAEATEYRARAQKYRCVVTASDGRAAESNAVAFEVAEPQAVLAATATTAPVALGEVGTFSCAVEGAGEADLSYQWQYSTDNGETWRALGWAGAKTETLTAEATEYRARAQKYRCVATASDGRTAESNAVAFEVAETLSTMSDEDVHAVVEESGAMPEASEEPEPAAETVTAPAVLAIVAQPEDCRGADADGWARFEVAAEGEGLAYRWEWTDDEGKTWAELPLPDDAEALKALGFVIEGADATGARAESEAVAYAPEKR